MEIWKDIKDYGGLYKVSDKGNIIGTKRNVMLSPYQNHKGYFIISLTKNSVKKTHSIHRLVAETFIPNPNNLPQVNHKNGIKTCNEVWNLEWTDNSGNQKHAFANGLQTNVGDNNPNMRAVDQYDLDGNFIKHWNSIYDITQQLGYSCSSIWRCCTNRHKKSHSYVWRYTK